MAGIDTVTNIRTKWTIIDLADANEALDIKEETEAFYVNQNSPKK